MFLEYDWTSGVYRPRFGRTFTSIHGWRSFASKSEARAVLAGAGLRLGAKTDSKVWQIETA